MTEQEKQALWPVVALALMLLAVALIINGIATILTLVGSYIFYSANEALKEMRSKGDVPEQ